MFTKRKRELEASGFEDALVYGVPDPGKMEIETRAYYDRGFEKGKRAVDRIVAESKPAASELADLVSGELGGRIARRGSGEPQRPEPDEMRRIR